MMTPDGGDLVLQAVLEGVGHQIGYLMEIEMVIVQTVAFLADHILVFARLLAVPLLSTAILAAVDAAKGAGRYPGWPRSGKNCPRPLCGCTCALSAGSVLGRRTWNLARNPAKAVFSLEEVANANNFKA